MYVTMSFVSAHVMSKRRFANLLIVTNDSPVFNRYILTAAICLRNSYNYYELITVYT